MTQDVLFESLNPPDMMTSFDEKQTIVLRCGDTYEFLRDIPKNTFKLIISSPPYNLGKEYEKRLKLEHYLEEQKAVIRECVRVLKPTGSICWQVGNYVEEGFIVPLDSVLYPLFASLGLKMRNRIIWHFEHGLHCSRRFSGRYETICWFTKTADYVFNLDTVRVPQKYPGKRYFKGPKAGQYSCNPLGKNPGDLWLIPNVKCNHVEKTDHPCQFPVELVERLVLSMTNLGDWVFDPFGGVGTTIIAAIRHKRRGAATEIVPKYVRLASQRIRLAVNGDLKVRPMGRPVYDHRDAGRRLLNAPWLLPPTEKHEGQMALLERPESEYRTK